MELESQPDARLLPVSLEVAHSHSSVSRKNLCFARSVVQPCQPQVWAFFLPTLHRQAALKGVGKQDSLLHLHMGVSSAHYQEKHEACARLTINAIILQPQLNKMHSQKNKKKEGEEKYVPSSIAKLSGKIRQ